MNWIDMDDKDKLFNYAKDYELSKPRVLAQDNNTDSYYEDYRSGSGIQNFEIMEYNIENFVQLKKQLIDIWGDVGFTNLDLLATIVSTAAIKNMPVSLSVENNQKISAYLLDKPIEKTDYESVNENDVPPVFIYEF